MAGDWASYFCNVNDVLASIFLNLELRASVPDKNRSNLLWVWVAMKSPREDGLSSKSEFEILCSIDDMLTETLAEKFDAVFCGRITTDGRREFYYYATHSEQLQIVVENAMSRFRGYEFDCGWKADPEWRQYLDVLYPSDENRQRIENRKVLDALERQHDTLKAPRDVSHWIYFQTEKDRGAFRSAVLRLEYRVQSEPPGSGSDFPFGLCIVRFQSVQQAEIDNAVIDLFRLAKKFSADYDGWETQVFSSE
jgi:uncharacterized protein (TIGR01619 family)